MKYSAAAVLTALIFLTLTAAQKKDDKKDDKKQQTVVSFSRDVQPVLSKKCLDCHTTDEESSNGFYVDNYEALLKAAKHGPAIVPGKGEASIMIKKLRGTADFGARMPKRGKLVPDSITAIISAWIDQGAKKN